MGRKRRLKERAFPDVEAALHCVAVKVNDELNQLYSQPTLSQQEARKLAELTSLLLLVRKNLPSPTKRTKHHTLSATPTTPEVQEDVLE